MHAQEDKKNLQANPPVAAAEKKLALYRDDATPRWGWREDGLGALAVVEAARVGELHGHGGAPTKP